MAVSTPPALSAPRWPDDRIDPARVDVDYDPPSDELTLYFGGKPVPSVVDPIDSPGRDYVAVMIGLNDDESSPNEIVGIQVMPLLVGAVQQHPDWAVLAWGSLTGFRWEEEMMRAAVAAFIAEVADLFARHWTPPSPIEEQMARLGRTERTNGGGDASP